MSIGRPPHSAIIFVAMKTIYKTRNPQQTIDLGIQLATRLIPGDSILLFGDLGSGKTHFVKGVAKGLGVNNTVKSPTFAYVNKYHLESGTDLREVLAAAG